MYDEKRSPARPAPWLVSRHDGEANQTEGESSEGWREGVLPPRGRTVPGEDVPDQVVEQDSGGNRCGPRQQATFQPGADHDPPTKGATVAGAGAPRGCHYRRL